MFMVNPLEARRKKTCDDAAAVGFGDGYIFCVSIKIKNQFLIEHFKEYPF